jgi:hypothetical protein
MALGATRALRGTKTLTHAFFDAAEAIPVDRRPAVVKAALASIRDELKATRDKAKLAKAEDAAAVIKKAPARRTASKS